MTTILQEKMLLKKDNIRTRLEVTGSNSNKIKKEMALLEKLDLAVDKDASDMCGRVGLGTSNIMSMACELLLHNEAMRCIEIHNPNSPTGFFAGCTRCNSFID